MIRCFHCGRYCKKGRINYIGRGGLGTRREYSYHCSKCGNVDEPLD